jgi:phospholipid/cholesterol/gamma-HCH transport system substrate-binding protein
MRVNKQLHGLVRTDSVVTVDTEGVVGDTFLAIHSGSPSAAIAPADSVLQSKPPLSMSDLLTHGLGIMNDADATIKQVGGKLNVALDGLNGAVGNANDLLVGKRAAGRRACFSGTRKWQAKFERLCRTCSRQLRTSIRPRAE